MTLSTMHTVCVAIPRAWVAWSDAFSGATIDQRQNTCCWPMIVPECRRHYGISYEMIGSSAHTITYVVQAGSFEKPGRSRTPHVRNNMNP